MARNLFLLISWLTATLPWTAVALFSGFYSPKESEDYGGAFLVSKERLIASKRMLDNAWYPEGIIFSVVHPKDSCRDCKTIFTRDYFDFSSDHLSSTTNIIGTMPSHTQIKIIQFLNQKLKDTLHEMKRWSSFSSPPQGNTTLTTQRRKIVGIIPFSEEVANPNSHDHTTLQLHQQMRRYFFQITFYSLYRYFSQIIVYVATTSDQELIQSWKIPFTQIHVMDSILDQVPKERYFFHDPFRKEPRPRNQLLPKYSLLAAVESLEKDPSWAEYQYVYYTEGDQILHLRKMKSLLKAIDSRDGKDILVPHRMQVNLHLTLSCSHLTLQTLPLYQNIPSPHSDGWNYQILSGVNLITESTLAEVPGSCCDNARFAFRDCGNWWYYCQQWGVKNHTVWLQYGSNGFTMPLSTEHQGICSYSPNQILCPLPAVSPTCDGRTKNHRYNTSALCGEVEFSSDRQSSFSFISSVDHRLGSNRSSPRDSHHSSSAPHRVVD
jgi:hypothetical protein